MREHSNDSQTAENMAASSTPPPALDPVITRVARNEYSEIDTQLQRLRLPVPTDTEMAKNTFRVNMVVTEGSTSKVDDPELDAHSHPPPDYGTLDARFHEMVKVQLVGSDANEVTDFFLHCSAFVMDQHPGGMPSITHLYDLIQNLCEYNGAADNHLREARDDILALLRQHIRPYMSAYDDLIGLIVLMEASCMDNLFAANLSPTPSAHIDEEPSRTVTPEGYLADQPSYNPENGPHTSLDSDNTDQSDPSVSNVLDSITNLVHLANPVHPEVTSGIVTVDKCCELCHSTRNEDQMLLCDRCNDGWHTYCLQPALLNVPIDSWYCPACKENNRGAVDQQVLLPRHL